MKIKNRILLGLLLVAHTLTAQVPIIYDTDFGGDADDLGALAMLHHFVDADACELLGVMVWTTETYAIPAIDAVNTYYNHPNIPLAVRKGGPGYNEWNYNKVLADKFPHRETYESVPSTTELYRKLLSESKNKSVVIVTVGPLKNIEDLLKSEADQYSKLSGKDLVKKKVKSFVVMGGQFPEGKQEWNFDGNMRGVTKYVIENVQVPITYSGFEVGAAIKIGERFNNIDKESPLYIGFKHFSEFAPWMKETYNGKIQNNSTFDQTAVLYAVYGGVGKYWEKVHGYCKPDEVGGNGWVDDATSENAYLKLIMPQAELVKAFEDFMLGNM